MACLICHEFEYNPNVTFRGGREPMDYFKVSEVEASARSCKFCNALFSILEGVDLSRIPNLGIRNDTRDGTFKGIIFDIEGESGYALPFGRSPDYTPPHARYTLRNLSKISIVDAIRTCESGLVNTGSAPGVQWAQDKIRECQNNHSDCKQKIQGVLPDRVLSIGSLVTGHSSDGEETIEADVKLYETSGETLPYAALSHRWGNSRPLCLRLDNISEFRQGISWEALPKTFKQAAIFARKLGLQYIWIDSLCIIQDSKDDWLVQSGKMAGIYENALITLAATASSGAASGCFVEPPLPLQGYVMHGTTTFPASDHIAIQSLLADESTTNPVIYIKALAHHNTPGHYIYEDLPLLKRGWVYQERLLSPRIVHFGTVDLIWECNHDLFCYCGFYVPQVMPGVTGNPVKPQHAACLRIDSPTSTSAAAMQWNHIIQSYTMLDLTYGSDRLPAIAGVAKQFRRGLKNKNYLAGLWEESLVVGLAWCRATRDNVWHEIWSSVLPLGPRPPTAAEAPSWSWLSIPGPVTYVHPSDKWSEAGGPEVVNVAFDRDGDTEFTTLQRGSITLRGRLIACKQRRIRAEGRVHDGVIRPGQKGFFKIYKDYSTDEDKQWQEVTPRWAKGLMSDDQDGSSPVHQLPADEDLDDEIPKHMSWAKSVSTQQCSKEFYALFMGTRIGSGSQDHSAIFLLLDRSDRPEKTYTRIGLGEYLANLSLFDTVEETQDVVLV